MTSHLPAAYPAPRSGRGCNWNGEETIQGRLHDLRRRGKYDVHPQTLRLYEREGLLKPSRSDGNTRLYTDEDLERLEVILKLTGLSARSVRDRAENPVAPGARDRGIGEHAC